MLTDMKICNLWITIHFTANRRDINKRNHHSILMPQRTVIKWLLALEEVTPSVKPGVFNLEEHNFNHAKNCKNVISCKFKLVQSGLKKTIELQLK